MTYVTLDDDPAVVCVGVLLHFLPGELGFISEHTRRAHLIVDARRCTKPRSQRQGLQTQQGRQ